jgi:hypothetical protein
MNKLQAEMNDKLRKLHNELLIKNEVINLLKNQVEEDTFEKAFAIARVNCSDKLKKASPNVKSAMKA